MLDILDDYDWEEVFKYASNPQPAASFKGSCESFTRENVATVLAFCEGENDGDSWRGFFELKDGRFAYIEAWCDYTGWG